MGVESQCPFPCGIGGRSYLSSQSTAWKAVLSTELAVDGDKENTDGAVHPPQPAGHGVVGQPAAATAAASKAACVDVIDLTDDEPRAVVGGEMAVSASVPPPPRSTP